MPESEFNFFKDVKNLSMMGPVSIKTVNGPDYSQSTTNVNPYTNYGQHAAGGRIDNYGEERRTVSAQDLGPSNTVPDSEPRPVRYVNPFSHIPDAEPVEELKAHHQ